MSKTQDLPPAVARIIGDLRAEVRVLTSRVQTLEARIALLEEFELVGSAELEPPANNSEASGLSVAGASAREPSSLVLASTPAEGRV